MCFKNKNNILKEFYKIFCEKVWGVILPIDCFAILLMISMVVHVITSRVMSHGTFQWSPVNTCSEYRIPPQNTPEVMKAKNGGFCMLYSTKHDRFANVNITVRLSHGSVQSARRPRGPYGPQGEDNTRNSHFFPIFSWFFPYFLWISNRSNV